MSEKPPLVTHIYTADPSAHVFNNKLYIYPSHDTDAGIEDNDNGDQYAMCDYHVLSLDSIDALINPNPDPDLNSNSASTSSAITDHGIALRQEDIPWVSKQLWAPDAAQRNGEFYLYFPARDKAGVFRIGVAVGPSPHGPFTPDPEPIADTFSIDPAVFVNDGPKGDGEAYLYFGGIWGGQLQCWTSGEFNKEKYTSMEAQEGNALCAKVARLSADMRSLASPVQDVVILDPATNEPLLASDHERRFFEAAWLHVYNGTFYFSYSTGDTHFLCYATSSSPLGPFMYAGRILEPVVGWTTHHSIVEWGGRWWLFYHDASLSGGINHLRCVKVRELVYDAEGRIGLREPQGKVVG